MFVESEHNFEILREINFSLFGMGPKYRRRAERMKPDDRVLFYVQGLRKWPASATITSNYFEDDTPMWKPMTKNDSFRYRISLKANIVLDECDYIDAKLLAPRLEYIKRWIPEDWPLAFWDRLHLLPQADFRLIEDEMQRIASKMTPREDPTSTDVDEGGTSRNNRVSQIQNLVDSTRTSEPVICRENEIDMESYPDGDANALMETSNHTSSGVNDGEHGSEVVSNPIPDLETQEAEEEH